MCINKRWIRNKYNGQKYFVNCGHCPSCEMEKSNNVYKRIINTFSSRYDVFFITLTYKNCYIPYIRKSEMGTYPMTIYRDAYCKRIRATTDYQTKRHMVVKTKEIGIIEDAVFDDPKYLHSLHHYDPDKVGVCYYKDVQNYFKRFRQILIRRYGLSLDFKYFSCSEYGTKKKSFRPHFHILLFFPRGFASVARAAHYEAWHFDSYKQKSFSFEIAREPASYLSKYLSKSADLSKFYRSKFIRQKHSYSQGFGASSSVLGLDSLLQKIERGDLTFNMQYIGKDGVPQVRTFLFPRYVANRYFPKFKGDYLLTSSQIYDVIKSPLCLERYKTYLSLNDHDIRKIKVRFSNCICKFLTTFYKDFIPTWDIVVSDYSRYYIKFWTTYRSQLYKRLFDNIEFADFYQLYDNFVDVRTGHVPSDYFRLYLGWNLELDPNLYPMNLRRNDENYLKFLRNRSDRELNDVLWSVLDKDNV